MGEEFYYIYSQGILGVKTNIQDFKWVYGSVAPTSSEKDYERCIVKFDITLKKEKFLNNNRCVNKKFQAFEWDSKQKMISYRRTLPLGLTIGYDINIHDDFIHADIGTNYYRFVKNRFMNLHGVYYLLSDLANLMLLRKGLLTLYASAVYSKEKQRGILHFAPPNTGKTTTALKLCDQGSALVGEDVLITDGSNLYSCPWTNSYRGKSSALDSEGSFARKGMQKNIEIEKKCLLTDLVVLSIGDDEIIEDEKNIASKILILNGYLFNYYSSPIAKVLAYFYDQYDKPWDKCAESLLTKMMNDKKCYFIQVRNREEFAEIIYEKILDRD